MSIRVTVWRPTVVRVPPLFPRPVGDVGGLTDGVVGGVLNGVVGDVVNGVVVKGFVPVPVGTMVEVEVGPPPPLGFTRGEKGSFPTRNPDGGGVRGVGDTGSVVDGADVGGGVVIPGEVPIALGPSPPFGRRNRKKASSATATTAPK